MRAISKKLLMDEKSRPVGVLIDYDDWLEIERSLSLRAARGNVDLQSLSGSIELTEDPLDYQNRLRAEWP